MIMKVNCKSEGKVLSHTWSKCVGAGRACEGLRKEWQRQLQETVKQCGFSYIRFHGLLAEDMFPVMKGTDGLRYNWYYIDQLYDDLLEIGIRPIVETGFMPPALASGEATQFWWRGNITPPNDYEEWGKLIGALVNHFTERYGREEVRKWYFEVWNEPNLNAFWSGTRSQYLELYKVTAEAVKAVDSAYRVGGPATSNFVPDDRFAGEIEDSTKQMTHLVENLNTLEWHGVWIEEFLQYCQREKLPVDFISAHPYPTDFALDGQQEMKGRTRCVDSLQKDITWLLNARNGSAYPNAEILLTEWSSSPTSRDCSHDFLPVADYIVKCNLDNAGRVDALSYWAFTDIFEEVGGGPEAFHGGFGLLNEHGIKKPAFWAYTFLHRLGTMELARDTEGIVTKTDDGKVQALFYNYAKELPDTVPIAEYPEAESAVQIQKMGQERTQELLLSGLDANAVIRVEVLDVAHTAAELWRNMGCPKNLTIPQEKALKAVRPYSYTVNADQNGDISLKLRLAPWSLVFLESI